VCVPPSMKGPYKTRTPFGFKRRPAPARSPSAASQGAMWTIFKEIIASNGASSSTPHTSSRTSIATGARTLASPLLVVHASMLEREASSGSLGSQTILGSALAKQTTCSPVPDPISSTMPFLGRTRVSTSRMGTQLRAADGENCRVSVAATGRRRWLVSDMSICYLTQRCASGARA
jgi:hypothetical protein